MRTEPVVVALTRAELVSNRRSSAGRGTKDGAAPGTESATGSKRASRSWVRTIACGASVLGALVAGACGGRVPLMDETGDGGATTPPTGGRLLGDPPEAIGGSSALGGSAAVGGSEPVRGSGGSVVVRGSGGSVALGGAVPIGGSVVRSSGGSVALGGTAPDGGSGVAGGAVPVAGSSTAGGSEPIAGSGAIAGSSAAAGSGALAGSSAIAGGDGGIGGEEPTAGAGNAGGAGGVTPYGMPEQSCTQLAGTECQGESCCTSILVPAGILHMGRSTDGTDAGEGDPEEVPEHRVAVSEFMLDKYEVTVGRFRAFVDSGDWVPPAGAGANAHAKGTGWKSSWNVNLPTTVDEWDARCRFGGDTWTPTGTGDETLPINCANWFEALAFCIWDGGRLPTEAEWEYAAAGGEENRLYPWGDESPGADCLLANYAGCGIFAPRSVGLSPDGAGRWGHLDLAGNLWEATFDWYDGDWYTDPAATGSDVCNQTPAEYRVKRGGYHANEATTLRAAQRYYHVPADHWDYFGIRCARDVQ